MLQWVFFPREPTDGRRLLDRNPPMKRHQNIANIHTDQSLTVALTVGDGTRRLTANQSRLKFALIDGVELLFERDFSTLMWQQLSFRKH